MIIGSFQSFEISLIENIANSLIDKPPASEGYRTLRGRTVRQNFQKRADGAAESCDTHNSHNMDGAAELDTVSVINEGKLWN